MKDYIDYKVYIVTNLIYVPISKDLRKIISIRKVCSRILVYQKIKWKCVCFGHLKCSNKLGTSIKSSNPLISKFIVVFYQRIFEERLHKINNIFFNKDKLSDNFVRIVLDEGSVEKYLENINNTLVMYEFHTSLQNRNNESGPNLRNGFKIYVSDFS